MPPPPMMPWGIPPPPPPPRPASLASLTTAELQRMEGTERRNIEARLQLLREIQEMLDASVLLMQQYSAVVANLPQNSATVATQTDAARPEPEVMSTQPEPDVVPTTSGLKPSPPSPPSPQPSTSATGTDHSPGPGPSRLTPDSNDTRDKTDADAEELRRRRLQKFT